MKRRKFLKISGLSGLASLLPGGLLKGAEKEFTLESAKTIAEHVVPLRGPKALIMNHLGEVIQEIDLIIDSAEEGLLHMDFVPKFLDVHGELRMKLEIPSGDCIYTVPINTLRPIDLRDDQLDRVSFQLANEYGNVGLDEI